MPDTACLLIHGFGGAPFEMLPVAEVLEARGYAVSVPTLPGHAATVEEWSRTRWSDWLEHVSAEYERLASGGRRVFVVGLSMGGSLSLALAERHKPAGVAVIAAPVYLYRFLPPEASDWLLPLVGLLRQFRPIWPRPSSPESDSRIIAPWEGYEDVVALDPLHSFMRGLRRVRRDLRKITSPLMAVHAPLDRVVPFGNLHEIIKGVESAVRRPVVLPIAERVTKHHILTTHVETRAEVARACLEFVREMEGAG